MAANYEVNYNIRVVDNGAIEVLNRFRAATEPLLAIEANFNKLANTATRLMTNFTRLSGQTFTVRVDTASASAALDNLLVKARAVAAEMRTISSTLAMAGGAGGRAKSTPKGNARFSTYKGQVWWGGQTAPSPNLLPGYNWVYEAKHIDQYKTRLNELYRLKRAAERTTRLMSGYNVDDPKMVRAVAQYERYARQMARITHGYRAVASDGSGRPPIVPPAPYREPKPKASTRTSTASARSFQPKPSQYWPASPNNLGYKLLGPTPLPNNGGMIVDMMKGMGIAYGIAGAMQAVGEVVSQSVEYDNLMTTVQNILLSHDNRPNFTERFKNMENVVRSVGKATKYTVTEVADAAKFLAMAGLELEDINQAIRPIADIALIGDTELGETADMVTNIMTAYHMKSYEMRRAADIMTNTFTMSNTTLTEIAESYKYSAAILSAAGVDFGESTAAIGILGNAGVKASQAGTTMRTIMANLINPTKKQRQAWKDIGIDPTGKGMMEVFMELNRANVSADKFFKLFHRTAAQGAVSLAKEVDRWNEIVIENFLSEGLSSRLAEKKKNTVQGLWAQMTSTFMDEGVKAFNRFQSPLKNWIKGVRDYMLSEEGANKIQSFADTVADFGKTAYSGFKWLIGLFDQFGWFIKQWAKFQLTIWPVVKALSALKSVYLALQAYRGIVGSGANAIRSYIYGSDGVGSVSRIKGEDGKMIPMKDARGRVMYNSPISWLPQLTEDDMKSSFLKNKPRLRGRELPANFFMDYTKEQRREYYRRYFKNKYLNDMKAWQRKAMAVQAWNGAKGLGTMALGGAGMMVGMNKIFSGENFGENFAGVMYSLAGIAAMTGQWWAAAGLAVAGGVSDIIGSISAASEAMDKLIENSQRLKVVNGITSNADDPTQRYFEYVYTRNKDINALVEERIRLTKQLLGIQNGDISQADSMFAESKKFYNDKFVHWYQFGDRETLREALGKTLMSLGSDRMYTVGGRGHMLYIQEKDGWNQTMTFSSTEKLENSIIAADVLNKQLKPQLIEKFTTELNKMVLAGKPYEEIQEYAQTFLKAYDPAYIEGLISPANMKKGEIWTGERMMKDELAMTVLYDNLKKVVDESLSRVKGYAEYIEAREAAKNSQEELAKLKAITPSEVLDAIISIPGSTGLVAETYKKFLDASGNLNMDEWLRTYSLYDGRFHPENGESVETVMRVALKSATAFIKIIKQLGLATADASKPMIEAHNKLMTQAIIQMGLINNGKLDNNGNLEDGATAVVEGEKYTYNKDKRLWVSGFIGAKDYSTMSKEEMATKLADEINKDNDNPLGTGIPNPSAYSSEYKSNYRNNSAAPKQVIVNIENLMNVESVDLSKPDNQMAVTDIKQQLTQALVDVVHDFDVTYS